MQPVENVKKGHIEQICHSKTRSTGFQTQATRQELFQTNAVSDLTNILEYSENSEEYTVFTIQNTRDSTKPLIVTITLKIDTSPAVTRLPKTTYRAISTDPLQYNLERNWR